MKVCVAAECDSKAVARGLCNRHWKRAKTDGTLDQYKGMPKVCKIDECSEKVRSGGLCNYHYIRWYEKEKRKVSPERREAQKEYYRELARRNFVDVPPDKKCPKCQQLKANKEFYRSRHSKDGLMPYCKSCERVRTQTHWKSSGGRSHISLNYLARKTDALGELPPNARQILAEFYGDFCAKCGSTTDLQIDHVISLKNGGSNCLENTQLLCKSDNTSKGRKNEDYRDRSRGVLLSYIEGKFIVDGG